MKAILKRILLNLIAIFLVASLLPGLQYGHRFSALLYAAIALGVINAFIKPFLKILFLPVNVITFGLFSWVINVVILYLVVLIVPGIDIVGFSLNLFDSTFVFSKLLSYIAISIALSLVTNLISTLLDSK